MNTKIKVEKRIVEFKLIAHKCFAFLGIGVQLSQTLTATNLSYCVRRTTEKDCSLNLRASQMSDKQPSLSILCQFVIFCHNESRVQSLYWNLSIMDTLGPHFFACNKEVFFFETKNVLRCTCWDRIVLLSVKQ